MTQQSGDSDARTKQHRPGVRLETVVARIQQMMDPNSTVTHNEWLNDRIGNKRQYDVVIRGQFGGRPVLGVIECKDHSRKKGPETVEAFAKKTEHLGANLRLIVSTKGFTEQALRLAKHENIGCRSLLPDDPAQAVFSIGEAWFGVIRMWTDVRLLVEFAVPGIELEPFDSNTVMWQQKPVANWFIKELLTTHAEDKDEGTLSLRVEFDRTRDVQIGGKEHPITAITCVAQRVFKNKRKWVSWSGDAFYDWHSGQFTIPSGGSVVGSAVESDLSLWDDCDGVVPDLETDSAPTFLRAVLYNTQKWDSTKDGDVPDLGGL